MKLYIEGPINPYYVQTLCMIYFPGVRFSDDENAGDEEPRLWVTMARDEQGVSVRGRLSAQGKEADAGCTHRYADYPEYTKQRVEKIAVGEVVLSVGSSVMGYRPAWGMLTGVRPSKVASEMLRRGWSKTKVRKELNKDYFVIPKKAALATDVAIKEAQIIGKPERTDCSIYISIPFCPSRCAYCSFVSYTSKRLLSLIPDYLVRLARDLEGLFACVQRYGLRVRTIYIGGGTPTILDAAQLRFLLETIARLTDVQKVEEYTLEAGRPDTISREKLEVARSLGIGRVSVNPQILCEDVLRGIGRSHTVEDFYKAYDTARQVGIPCINTDLIAGLPGDRFPIFSASFDRIMALRPENVTIHTFCVKRSAELRQIGDKIYSARGGDTGKCVDYSQITCMHEGYVPYYMYRQKNTVGNFENVGFARPGYEGLYNIYMMEEVHSVLAAGAGAVTKLVDVGCPSSGVAPIQRLFHPKYPYEYLSDAGERAMQQRNAAMDLFYEQQTSYPPIPL